MNLIILPGAGDPFHNSSKEATELLFYYANKNNYKTFKCVSYPGHSSYEGSLENELKIETTKKVIIKVLQYFENFNEEYNVFVRSYGCNPYLDILANENLELKFLKKSIIWGSSPLHLIYQGATELFNEYYTEGLNRGVVLSKNIFEYTYPIEAYVQKEIDKKVIYCSGTDDNYSPQSFYDYLKAINKNKNNHFSQLIPNERHTVYKPNELYEKLIFE